MPEEPKASATVCIPWRPSPSRVQAFHRVRQFWNDNFPGWPIVMADSNTEIFNLGAARNNAVKQANTEVVVIADADTLPPIESIEEAVDNPAGFTWACDRWRLIHSGWLFKPLEELPGVPVIREHYAPAPIGPLVCRTQEYFSLGGTPEFDGWGGEDVALYCAAKTLSTVRHLPGIAYSFEHNDVYGRADSPGWDRDIWRNREQMLAFQYAEGNVEKMVELLKLTKAPRS